MERDGLLRRHPGTGPAGIGSVRDETDDSRDEGSNMGAVIAAGSMSAPQPVVAAAAATDDGRRRGLVERIPVIGPPVAAVLRSAGAVSSGMGSATRHALDSVFFGLPSDRWNARNAYRTRYSDAQRFGADMGDASTAMLAPAAAALYVRRGMPVRGSGAIRTVGTRTVALGALGGMGLAGARKVHEHVQDRGNLAPVLGPAMMVGSALLAARLGGRAGGLPASLPATGAGIAGLALGSQVGSRIEVGESQLGKPYAKSWVPASGPVGQTGEFLRGAHNHFAEVGPGSQGISFANPWRMREAFRSNYSLPEQRGSMLADLGTGILMGGGALAAARAVTLGTPAGTGLGPVSGAIATNAPRLAMLPGARGGTLAIGAGLAIAEGVRQAGDERDLGRGVAGTVVAGGALAGLTMAASRGRLSRSVPAQARPMVDAMTAIALFSALSAARRPVNSFISGSQDTWAQADRDRARTAALVAAPVLAVPGARMGAWAARMLGATGRVGMGVGLGVGAAAGAASGAGLAPVLPGVPRAGSVQLPVEPTARAAHAPA